MQHFISTLTNPFALRRRGVFAPSRRIEACHFDRPVLSHVEGLSAQPERIEGRAVFGSPGECVAMLMNQRTKEAPQRMRASFAPPAAGTQGSRDPLIALPHMSH